MERNTKMKIRLSEIERGYLRLAMEHAGYTKINEFAQDLLLSFAEQQIGDEVYTHQDFLAQDGDLTDFELELISGGQMHQGCC